MMLIADFVLLGCLVGASSVVGWVWRLRWCLVCLLGGYCSLFCGWFGCVFVGSVVAVVMRCQRAWFGFWSCSSVVSDCAGG